MLDKGREEKCSKITIKLYGKCSKIVSPQSEKCSKVNLITIENCAALDNLMEMTEFKIPSALIASQSEKIEVFGKTTYMPIYDLMFLDRTLSTEPLIYKID